MDPTKYHHLWKTMMRSIFAKDMDSLTLVLWSCGLDGEQAATRHNIVFESLTLATNMWLFACMTIDVAVHGFKSFLSCLMHKSSLVYLCSYKANEQQKICTS